jgi:hypothetical protein
VTRSSRPMRHVVNRRAFLYGAGGIAIGLPYLEGMPERSAWAQTNTPVFSLFICGACGVEPKRFWPSATGALSTALASGDKAVNELKEHAANLLIVKGVNFPNQGPQGCGHAEGLVQALTGAKPKSTGSKATAAGPSADVVISKAVNPAGTDPLTLYAGNIKNGYIAERLSFDQNGNARAGVDTPYKLYQTLMGVAPTGTGGPDPGGGTTPPPPKPSVTDELLARRKSAVDYVHAELKSLIQNPKLSAADKERLQQHFDSIRDVEITMTMGPDAPVAILGCGQDGLDTTKLQAVSSYRYTKTAEAAGGMENSVELHMQLVALAFACNLNRTATIQAGDGTDATIYDVPSNKSLGNWGLHFISHRTQSDGSLGNNTTAEAAHAEIDVIRMKTLAKGLSHFRDRGLADKSVVVWTNHIAEGNHTMRSVPYILWGNGGGYFKQGQFIDGGGAQNGKLLNMVVSAATGTAANFAGGGDIAAAKA